MKRYPARYPRAAPFRASCFILLGAALLLATGCATSADHAPASPPVVIERSPTGENHDASELSQLPRPRLRMAPQYPFMLRKKGLTGTATVEFIINKRGDVVNAFAVRATYPEFGEAAVDCISRWKFVPGLKDGRPVNCRMQQDLFFDLEPAKPAKK